ncbi:MAG: CotH kinase family protein [Ignavibacteria bacterium]|nr:CotH kinase family protein [Ignavibacteria bacterium]
MKSSSDNLRNSVLTVLFSVILLSGTGISKAAEGDSLFTGIQIHTVNIRFSQPNYWDSLIYYYNQGLEQYMSATVIANGVTYANVGVRLKGNSSFTHPNNKKSFRLSFNEFVSGQRWNGLKGVHLNNCWNDPTFIREKMHLDFCKNAGITAPRGNFVRLSVNDTLFAFYSLVEHVDKTFLNSRYGNNSGDFFKAVDGYGTSDDVYSDFRWLGTDTSLYPIHYELKSDLNATTWSKLISFIDTLNHTSLIPSYMTSRVDLSAYYKAVAADILLGNMDSYVYSGRNFYFYYPTTTNKLEWIVWDAGLSFGGLPGGPSNIENLSLNYVVNDTARPLFSKITGNSSLNNDYLMAFCNLFNSYFSTTLLFPKIDSLANAVRQYVNEDPRKMFSSTQFENNLVSDITVSGRRIPGLKSFVLLRRTSVQSQLNTLGINCEQAVLSNEVSVPEDFYLSQNYPNPFNPSTRIDFTLFKPGAVSLTIYDYTGKEVVSLLNYEYRNSGNYSLEWNGKDGNGNPVSTGMYFYKFTSAGSVNKNDAVNSVTKKMILLK